MRDGPFYNFRDAQLETLTGSVFYSKSTHPLKNVLFPSVSISVLSQLLRVLP